MLGSLDPQAGNVGIGLSDMAMSGDDRYLCAINSFEGSIKGFAVGEDGSLTMTTSVGGLPINPFAPLSSSLASRDAG